MRIVVAILCLFLSSTIALAKARVYITAPPPNAVIICPYVTASVAWDWDPARQAMMLGKCPPPAAPR